MSESGLPGEITFRNLDASPLIGVLMRKRADDVGRCGARILGRDVVVEAGGGPQAMYGAIARNGRAVTGKVGASDA